MKAMISLPMSCHCTAHLGDYMSVHQLCMGAGIVLARLGADVTATDLGPNLPLLRDNSVSNGAVL